MVITPEQAAAARNNAVWCDTVCRAYGRPGEFLPGLWVNREAAPRFYPNIVTLAAGDEPLAGDTASLRECLHVLGQAGLPTGWGVKDSFHAHDLAPLGFRRLFEAAWIWRPADALPPPFSAGRASAGWSRVRSAPELAAWESAWGTTPEQDRLFPLTLLADPMVAFLAAYAAGQIIAGAIANHSGAVVGLSNLFGPDGPTQSLATWAGAIAAAREAFPGQPLVGYEAGADLAAAQAAGFAAIGPLQVWVSDD